MKRRKPGPAGWVVWTMLVGVAWLVGGCAGPGAELFPIASVETRVRADGTSEQWYDMDGSGRADFCEIASEDGRIVAIGYDRNGDGRIDEKIVLADVPPEEHHHLVIILDSIPPLMVEEMQVQGRLRYFPPTSRVVCPFPVMTDVSLTEFFGLAPVPGVEASYHDGQQLRGGLGVYLHEENMPWTEGTHYYLGTKRHLYAYLWHRAWYLRDLRRVQEVFAERDRQGETLTVAYVVGPSALGARQGRDGHAMGLVALDRFCQEMVHRTRGRVRISLLSDHGHTLAPSRRIPLSDLLEQLGYRSVTGPLRHPDEVAVPEFGVVNCAVIYTLQPERVAGDVIALEGVELASYKHRPTDGAAGHEVVVLSRTGRARIDRNAAGFRYRAEVGDPLKLGCIVNELVERGQVDQDGYIRDGVLFEATIDHVFPDAVYRLWRAFDGLIIHEPDVMLSLGDEYAVGSDFIAERLPMQSLHGNLRPLSSLAFAMSMAGELPESLRMIDLRAALQEIGVPIPAPSQVEPGP